MIVPDKEINNVTVSDWIFHFTGMVIYYYLRADNPVLERYVDDFLLAVNGYDYGLLIKLWNLNSIDLYSHLKSYVFTYEMKNFIGHNCSRLSEVSLGEAFEITIKLLESIITKPGGKSNSIVVAHLEKMIADLLIAHEEYLLSQEISNRSVKPKILFHFKINNTNVDQFINACGELQNMATYGSTVCNVLLRQKNIKKHSILSEIGKLGYTTPISPNIATNVFLELSQYASIYGYTHIWLLCQTCSHAINDEY